MKPQKQVFFLHSAGPQGENEGSNGFLKYLAETLGDAYAIHAPLMPHPDAPDYHAWKEELALTFPVSGELILVGHSLGGSVLLKYLSEVPVAPVIAGLFLVSVPYWGKGGWDADEFTLDPGFRALLPPIPKVFLYHSTDDPFVAYEHLEHHAEAFPEAITRELPGDDHVFEVGLPVLIADIRDL